MAHVLPNWCNSFPWTSYRAATPIFLLDFYHLSQSMRTQSLTEETLFEPHRFLHQSGCQRGVLVSVGSNLSQRSNSTVLLFQNSIFRGMFPSTGRGNGLGLYRENFKKLNSFAKIFLGNQKLTTENIKARRNGLINELIEH